MKKTLDTLLSLSLAASCGAAEIKHTMDKPGQVSMGIYNADGVMVRELLHADPREKGPQTDTWDLLDNDGKPVPAGTYTWKRLVTQGLRAEYLMTLGSKSNPPWKMWPGNHNGVGTVTADAGGLYFASLCSEAPPCVIKVDFDGKLIWEGPFHGYQSWEGGASIAVDGGTLYVLQRNTNLQIVNAGDGKKRDMWKAAYNEEDVDKALLQHTAGTRVIAAHNGIVAISYSRFNAVRWFDPATGEVIGEANVPSPLGITITKDNETLVISGDKVLGFAKGKTSDPRALITGLASPFRISADPVGGEIFIAEGGPASMPDAVKAAGMLEKNSHQVKKFSADGKWLATFGREGGRLNRAQGRYDEPTSFYRVSDIAADGKGGFVITEGETAPRRSTRFDGNGQIIHEWYGGQQYANYSAPDPENPEFVWIYSGWGSVIQARVDYQNNTWDVYATYNFGNLLDGFIPSVNNMIWYVRHHNGHTYLAADGLPTVLRVDEANRQLVPVTSMRGSVPWGRPATGWTGFFGECVEALEKIEKKETHWVGWTDLNGDGKGAVDEIKEIKLPANWVQSWVEDDFTCLLAGGEGEGDSLLTGVWELPVKEWLHGTVPVYDYENIKQIVPGTRRFGRSQRYAVRDARRNAYVTTNSQFNPDHKDHRMSKWGPDGKLIWSVGKKISGPEYKPGEVGSITRMMGLAKGCVATGNFYGSRVPTWDTDGLWVGWFLENPNLDVADKEAYVLCYENFGGSIIEEPGTENVLFFGGSPNATPVYRISGWDKFERASGTLAVTARESKDVADALRLKIRQEAPDAWIIPCRYEIEADGDLSDWEGITPFEIKNGNETAARVYAAWSPRGLFMAWDIRDASPWKTTLNDRMVFQGAAADVNIGPLEPYRTEGIQGDCRVLLTPSNGQQPVFTTMLPKIPRGLNLGALKPETYMTGLGEVTFADVRQNTRPSRWHDAWAAMKTREGMGPILEVKIPVYEPFKLEKGYRFKMEASLILANEDGTRPIARLPWRSNAEQDRMVTDIFTEASLRPHNWGEAILE